MRLHVVTPTNPPGFKTARSAGTHAGIPKTPNVQKACVYVSLSSLISYTPHTLR
jgi:hypothetical protein